MTILLPIVLLIAAEAPVRTLTNVEVFPADVQLFATRERQSLVVKATYSDGVTEDVTEKAQFAFANPALAKMEGTRVAPAADGKTELTVSYGGRTHKLPVTVKGAAYDRPISFKQDVMPVFMKAGCNQGGCHGAARGKDGFRLSLFGFDADGDLHRLTRELNGRHVNLAIPEHSLLVEKSIGRVPHTGGKRFEFDDYLNEAMLRWMRAGAPADPANIPLPTGLEILPKNAVLEGAGAKQRMTVRATYSDGSVRDVTNVALFLSNNETSAKIGGDGVVTANERGEAFVMARFYTFTVGSQVIVVPKGLKYQWSNPAENNFIDTLVNNKLKKLRMLPSELCTDDVFIRRVFLDVIGVLPTRPESEKFVASTDPKKREKLIDELLGRKEFSELWVMKFAELLQIRSTNNVSYKATLGYFNWLQKKFQDNVPMNLIVQDLLGSAGGTFKTPETNYYQTETDNLKVAENVAQVFMGMRIQCAQCHNHPFDRWTMDDYYAFTAFFTQVGRKQGEDPREIIVFNGGGGEVNHPLRGRPMKPKFLGGIEPDVNGKDRRMVLSKWLASPENPYFAKNLSNIVWAHFFGRGIVEPVDDVRISNPASNPELIDELGKKFTEYNYDFKKLVRDICNSRTYQLSTRTNSTNELDVANFSHAAIRRIRAEVLYDIITQVTETRNKFQGLPLGARAVQIADGQVSTYFLTTFGRASRESVCSCEVKMEPNLSQSLHLLNGDTTNNKIVDGQIVAKCLGEKKLKPEEIMTDIYLRCFSRKPSEKELAALAAALKDAKEPRQTLEDMFWAVLNSKEFMFNH